MIVWANELEKCWKCREETHLRVVGTKRRTYCIECMVEFRDKKRRRKCTEQMKTKY